MSQTSTTGNPLSDRSYPLRHCVWEITLACCFSCSHCGSRAGSARQGELSTGECLSVADQLASLGCRRVSLIGGEVFLRGDWDAIAARLTSHGISVNIITNGYPITPSIVARLREISVESVSVSVDGTRDIHDAYRRTGSYDQALHAVCSLNGAGIPVSIITTLNGTNLSCLPQLYDAFVLLPIYAWQLQACSPMGNAAGADLPWRFSFGNVLDFVAQRAPQAPFALGVADNIGYCTPGSERLRGNLRATRGWQGCRAGITGIGIDSVGNVRGCESLYDERFIEGNLRQRSLREIWEDPGAFSYNRGFGTHLLTGACAQCPHGAQCAGGCRSYNFFAGRQLYCSPACALSHPDPMTSLPLQPGAIRDNHR